MIGINVQTSFITLSPSMEPGAGVYFPADLYEGTSVLEAQSFMLALVYTDDRVRSCCAERSNARSDFNEARTITCEGSCVSGRQIPLPTLAYVKP